MDREALWRLVTETKYNNIRGGWCSKEVTGTFGVGVWKYIRKGWDRFSKFVRFDLGLCQRLVFGMMFGVGIDR
jgi:hypothetical protein